MNASGIEVFRKESSVVNMEIVHFRKEQQPVSTKKPEGKKQQEEELVQRKGMRYANGETVIVFDGVDYHWGNVICGDDLDSDGPFYLVKIDDLDDEEIPVHEKDLRRPPFYDVGDAIEAKYVEDGEWYPAHVIEKFQGKLCDLDLWFF